MSCGMYTSRRRKREAQTSSRCMSRAYLSSAKCARRFTTLTRSTYRVYFGQFTIIGEDLGDQDDPSTFYRVDGVDVAVETERN